MNGAFNSHEMMYCLSKFEFDFRLFGYSNHLSYQRNKFSIKQGLQSVLRKHQSKYSDRIDTIGVTNHFELPGLQAPEGKKKRNFRFRYPIIILLFQV